MTDLPSPFGHPFPGLEVRTGGPPLVRPSKEEIEGFGPAADAILSTIWTAQEKLLANPTDLDWARGRHFLIAGATGPGLGTAIASALLRRAHPASVTTVSRDLTRSVGYETGKRLLADVHEAKADVQFQWLNDGLALAGPSLETLVDALRAANARELVYFNTVAMASSGLLPGEPSVYVKDVDEQGLFQWQLTELSSREVDATESVMGTVAVGLPGVLQAHGIRVEVSVFADWRGSLDRISRLPERPEYGRQGPYSTSLYLPKDVIQGWVRAAYGTDLRALDIFYPLMRTRALSYIPGGVMTADLADVLVGRAGGRRPTVPELAVQSLQVVGLALTEGVANPFPRLDREELWIDEWLYELVARLNGDPTSPFFYGRWLGGGRDADVS